MQTDTGIDEELVADFLRSGEAKTRPEAIEAAARLLKKIAGQKAAFDALRGLGWDGDLEESRRSRSFESGPESDVA